MREAREWIQTFTGQQVWPLRDDPGPTTIADIGRGLAYQGRFRGQSRFYYSIAQHSVLISRIVSPANRMWGLLHDATEAFLGDISGPLKHRFMLDLPNHQHPVPFCEVEDRLMAVIARRFHLTGERVPDEVKVADKAMLAAERDQIMSLPPSHWGVTVMPAPVTIEPMGPEEALRAFMNRFTELTGMMN